MTAAVDDPLLVRLTAAIVARIAPERILLFGSRARGDASRSSSFDCRRHDVGTLEYAATIEGKVLYQLSPASTARRVHERAGERESLPRVGGASRERLPRHDEDGG